MWEFSTYFYDTNAWLPKQMVFVNEQAFAKLPPNVQQAILDASKVAEKRGWEWSERDNDETPKGLVQNGMILSPISDIFRAELRTIGEQMLEDWLKKAGDDGKKIVDAYRAKLRS